MGSHLRELWTQLLAQVQESDGFYRDVLHVGLIDKFAVVVISFIIAFSYYRWWSMHPLYGQNKGPKVYPLLGSVVPFIRNLHRLPDYTYDLVSKTPGLTIRDVRPDGDVTILTCNPVNVEYILKTNFENYPKGKLFNGFFREFLGDGIFNADDHLWKFQRKQASRVFSTRLLRDFAVDNAAREAADRLLPFLSEASQSGRVFDLQDVFARFAFDNICQLGFREDPKCLDISLPRVKFAESFDRATLLYLNRVMSFPRFWWKFGTALRVGLPNELRLCVEVIDEFAMRVIKNRRQELALGSARGDQETIAGKADLLSMFMILEDEERGDHGKAFGETSPGEKESMQEQNLGRESPSNNDIFLRDIITSFILAGRDTTTSGLSWFFWLLSSHPHVESAILEEISHSLSLRTSSGDGALDDGQVKCGKNGYTFSFEELKSMHYLHAALTESMRLYPPVPTDMKTARKADVWPDGTVISPNTIVVYHPYTMGRLEELWGKDSLEFKPERWLKDGVFVPQSPYKYTTFQAGPRICLGKDMVMFQMKLVCAAVLSSFEICVPKDYKPQYLASLTLSIQNGLPVTARERKIL